MNRFHLTCRLSFDATKQTGCIPVPPQQNAINSQKMGAPEVVVRKAPIAAYYTLTRESDKCNVSISAIGSHRGWREIQHCKHSHGKRPAKDQSQPNSKGIAYGCTTYQTRNHWSTTLYLAPILPKALDMVVSRPAARRSLSHHSKMPPLLAPQPPQKVNASNPNCNTEPHKIKTVSRGNGGPIRHSMHHVRRRPTTPAVRPNKKSYCRTSALPPSLPEIRRPT